MGLRQERETSPVDFYQVRGNAAGWDLRDEPVAFGWEHETGSAFHPKMEGRPHYTVIMTTCKRELWPEAVRVCP